VERGACRVRGQREIGSKENVSFSMVDALLPSRFIRNALHEALRVTNIHKIAKERRDESRYEGSGIDGRNRR